MTEQVRRSARLVEIENLLRQNPRGLKTSDLAARTGYSSRTIQRDLAVLESELNVPLVEGEGRRWRLMPGATPIGSVRFTLQEARAMYLATRQFFRHQAEPDPDALSALQKLAGALPPTIAAQVLGAIAQQRQRTPSRQMVEVIRNLTEAWADSRSVTLHYRSQRAGAILSTQLDPYLLETSPNGAATYVIGYSHEHQQVRMFKVDRVLTATPTDQSFEPTGVEDLQQQLRRSWGIAIGGDEDYEVVVEFGKGVAERVQETNWHPTQRLTPLVDGRVRLELRLPSLLEFVPWVRSWGHEALVLAPSELVSEVAESLSLAARQYAAAAGEFLDVDG